MARKGNRKVRTGCLTCKSRKVKCDETKPLCKRCTSTGRHCEGYAAQPASAQDNYFDLLLRSQRPPRPYGVATTKDEGRALQYFQAAASPVMSGANDSSFWTKVVMQFTQVEPAVKHSVVAIGLLHEQMHKSQKLGVEVPELMDEYLPLKHYNLAIAELKTMDAIEKRPVVLFVCVMFICIEILQGNREVALQHCRHGLAILEQVVYHYPWTREYLIPMFRKLAIALYYFDDDTAAYSILDAFSGTQNERFESFDDAGLQMDDIHRRVLRLVKRAAAYRSRKEDSTEPPPEHHLVEQQAVDIILDEWDRKFTAYHDTLLLNKPNALMKLHELTNQFLLNLRRIHLSSMYEVARVWNSMALESDEMGYDDFMDVYEGVTDDYKSINNFHGNPDEQNRVLRFVFEMGLQQTIYFVITKCRDIKIRLHALSYIKKLGVPRENMWDSMHTFQICRRIVEIENDVVLDAQGNPLTPIPLTLPSDSVRVRQVWTISRRCKRMRNGELVPGRLICFLLPMAGGGNKKVEEFLCEDPAYLVEDSWRYYTKRREQVEDIPQVIEAI